MKSMGIFVVLFGLAFASVAFAEPSPGSRAFGAIRGIPTALRGETPNMRRACQLFGQYQAYKNCANIDNTDAFTLRNLGYREDSESVLAQFCSGPRSPVEVEDAIRAAESITSASLLESR